MPSPDLDALLAAAVAAVGGTTRAGQVRMAHAVADSLEAERHLLVQAGTGTGKSLAYLVPAIAHAMERGKPAVIATATLALQAQIVDRDLPRLADALAPLLGRRPTFALVKGRGNYLCVHKMSGGFPDEPDALIGLGEVDGEAGRLGREVVRLREWAQDTTSGDRDRLVPGVSQRAWRQVSVSARECLGSRCPMAGECFVEIAREEARHVDVIVTNHSFMAIDAFENRSMLPDHDLLVIDEAHELTDRVTSTITDEIDAPAIAAAARRVGRMSDASGLQAAGDYLAAELDLLPEGRLVTLSDGLVAALTEVRDQARGLLSELKPEPGGETDGARKLAQAAVDELFDTCDRLLEERELDVAWIGRHPQRGSSLRVAPMSVAMLVRDKVLGDRTVVMTSATLELGGTFDAVAGTVGLRGEGAPAYEGLDVGSPFDYPRQGIAYVARHLPAPGRDGAAPESMDEIEALIRAAGGRTLGLFSSRRAAEAAAEEMRERLGEDFPILCQGDDQIATLVRQFAGDARACLFGTLSLWQGVDVPGSACQLVIIDRIPFPRPDDPLASARAQAIAKMGGNGFMAVSATHAALRLAQGAGRLIRREDDRGVVAFLDSRMITARYAGFLQRSLPDFWATTDRPTILAALSRLDATAPPVVPVVTPAWESDVEGSADLAEAAEGLPSPDGEGSTDPRPVAPDPPPPPASRAGISGGVSWTSDADEELREGVDLGLSVAELADHLELPPDAVAERLRTLRLSVSTTPALDLE